MSAILEQCCPFPACGHRFVAPVEKHGLSMPCPSCGRALTVLDPKTARGHEAERLALALHRSQAADAQCPAPALGGGDGTFVALLENVRSLWNVGSIFRSADGAGVGRLILGGITGRPPRKEIAKTALGADEVVAWEHWPDPFDAARALARRGFRLLALEAGENSQPLAEARLDGPICLIVGHEVAGISPRLLELADQRLALPMRGHKQSLNVAVAFGVAAYEIAGRRPPRQGAAGELPGPARPPGTEAPLDGSTRQGS